MSDDKYIQAQKQWAAVKLDVARSDIKRVDFETRDGYWYSDYTYEPGEFVVEVYFHDSRQVREFSADPGDIIREICETMESM